MLAFVSVGSCLLSMFLACVALNVTQPYRLCFLFPILFLAFLGFVTINHIDAIVPGLGQLWGHVILIHAVHNTAVLYLEKLALSPDGVHQKWNLHAAYKICLNPQLLNTPWEVPCARKEKTNPSRTAFIRNRLCQLVIFYLINNTVVFAIFPLAFIPLSHEAFSAPQRVYFRRLLFSTSSPVTASETMLRAVFAFRWIWNNVIALHFAQTAVALLFAVILRWDEPQEWPALFGSPLEAYSLRRFWSYFWHRIVYRSYTAYGLRISRGLCGLRGRSLAEKVFVSMFVFLLSGVMHALVTWCATGCGYWRDIQWFLLNGVAMVGETMVVKWWTQPSSSSSSGEEDRRRARGIWMKKERSLQMVGYARVFAFLFWSVPKWEYEKLHCALNRIA